MNSRRRILTGLITFATGLLVPSAVRAEEPEVTTDAEEMRFPGDATQHNVVFQFNKADQDYHNAVLFAVGELLRKYGDNITIVVTAFGQGIHILAKKPLRNVSEHTRQKVKSLADYGVKFHACGNTMKGLDWAQDDMLPFAEIVQVGAADILELQEKGYSYLSW